MAVFPVTYVSVFFWLILATYENVNIDMKLSVRFMGNVFGIAVAILSLGGEIWVFSDGSGNFSKVIFNSGFALPLGLTLIGMCIIMLYMTIAAWLDRKKES